MLRVLTACLFAVCVVGGSLAAGRPVLAQATDMMGPAPKGDDPKICRRVTATDSPVGGSERLCKTAAEWQRYDKERQDEAQRQARAKAKPKG